MSNQTIPNKKTKSKVGKLFTYIFGGIVFLLLAFQIMGTVTARSNYGVPSFFGYQTLIVLTDSMEPAYKVDEAIVVKKVQPASLKASTSIDAQDGDVITFYRQADGLIVTHRIIDILPQEDGTYHFKTLGDNLNAQTCPIDGCDPDIHYDYVTQTDILGVVIGKSALFGRVVNVTTNPFVIASVAVIPLFYVFISSVADIVKHSKMKAEDFEDDEIDEFEFIKQQEKMKLLIEIEKQKLREELRQQKEITQKEGDEDE